MKKLLLILLCLPILFACNETEKRVLYDELINKGTEKSALMYYEGDLFNGTGYDVDPKGQLIDQRDYKNGKWNGVWKMFHTNDQVRWEREGKDGKEDGLSRWWFTNGQLEYEVNYKDGEKNGLWKGWNVNGQLWIEGNHKDGIEAGFWKYYDEDGLMYDVRNWDEEEDLGDTPPDTLLIR